MMALQSEVTRTDMKGTVWGAKQKISVEEAIRVGTLHGAHASFEERHKGSIEAGKLADLVVLGRDPLTENPSSLVRIRLQGLTGFFIRAGGQRCFARPGEETAFPPSRMPGVS